jgi:hypothetical protein
MCRWERFIEEKKEKNKVVYDYNATIVLKDKKGNEVYVVHKTGQMIPVNKNEKWLIDSDWSELNKIPNTTHGL